MIKKHARKKARSRLSQPYNINYVRFTIIAMAFGFISGVILVVSIISHLYSSDELKSPVPDVYNPTFPIRASVGLQDNDDQGSRDILLPSSEQRTIEAYIYEVFGKDADDAMILLTGDGKHPTCPNGENHNLDPSAVHVNANHSIDEGIFQINSVHNQPNMLDYKENIEYAYKMFSEQGWRPWTCSVLLSKTNYMGFTQ